MTDNPKALVTGVASGIGLAISNILKKNGFTVFGIDYKTGGDWLEADLSIPSERERVVHSAVGELGQIDVLVNVAGIYLSTPIIDSDLDDWRKVWAINLDAPLDLMRLVFPHMKQHGFGRIVNITSVHGKYSKPDCLAYDVAKAGLEAATRSVALSGAECGILVNAIAPGFVRTTMSLNADGVDEADTSQFREEFVLTGKLPLMRSADPSEIAQTVLWLAHSSNTYVTGQVLTVDGGLTATF